MLLSLAGCHQAKPTTTKANTVTITGKILTARGTAPLAAVAVVAEPGSKAVPVKASHDGSFTVTAPVKTAIRLQLAAVNHVEADLPVYFETNTPASVTVKLALDPFDRNAKQVEIALTENKKLSLHNGIPMKAQPDGTFVWEEDTKAPEIRYELIGITTNGHSVNGTQSDSFVYDGGGDFESVVHPSNGHIRIVYDPSKLPAPVTGQFPVVTWDAAHAALNTLASLSRDDQAAYDQIVQAAQAYRKAHHNLEGFKPDNTAWIQQLQQTVDSAKNPLVRAYAAVLMLTAKNISDSKAASSPTFVRSILDAAPPSSAAWSFEPRAVTAMGSLGDAAITTLEQFVAQNRDKQVQGFALYAEAEAAMAKHDTALQTKIYTRLKNGYADVPGMKYRLLRINPNKAIQVGKPLPDFAATLLTGKKISRKDLLGHYTLLDFWATWCPPCRAEMPNLDAAWKRFHRHNFQIISFSFDSSPSAIAAFRKGKWKMPWKHVFVKGGFSSQLAKTFEVEGIPDPILVGPDGTIIAVEPDTRGPELLATIQAAMAHKGTK